MDTPLRVTSDGRALHSWMLALQARGIPAGLQRLDGAFAVHVFPGDVEAAGLELDAVDEEEREARRAAAEIAPTETFHSQYAPIGAALFAIALLAFFTVSGPSAARSEWLVAGVSDAARVMDGEWWRTITALTLHADSNHLLSNLAIGTIVVTMVMRRTGVGLGAAAVVLAGALGNAVNAWGYGADHRSIGFSTAVFGAIGILGGLTYVDARTRKHGTRPAWIAIAGTLALLAMLGASERTDILAHLFGTLTGIAVGIAVAVTGFRPRAWPGQVIAGSATIAAVAGAWMMAFASMR